jgi:hypothetical protein
MTIRIAAGVVGLLYLLQGVGWLANPADAAKGLGMPLLDGMGRSTQVGDLSAFFLALGVMVLLGAYRANAQWLQAGALLIGLPAVTRSLVWLLHDAPFATTFIVIEVVSAGLLLLLASRIEPATRDSVS